MRARDVIGRAVDAGVALASRRRSSEEHLDMGPDFEADYQRAAEFTMTSRERMYALWQAARYISRAHVPGDVVECGVWRGGSSMLAALALGDDHRPLWLYDTYEGMSAPSDKDRLWSGQAAAERLAAQVRTAGAGNDWAYAPLADVQANMRSTGYPEDRIAYVQGKVEDTIPERAPETIALLRLDTDWYESTMHELKHLWPRLSVGGVLIIDDYGHWRGAQAAVDEYFTERPILLTRLDYTGRIAVKTA